MTLGLRLETCSPTLMPSMCLFPGRMLIQIVMGTENLSLIESKRELKVSSHIL